MKSIRAAVIGSTGYGGVELIRLLQHHPYMQVASVVSSSQAGEMISESYPHLTEIVKGPLDQVDVSLLKDKADIVFTATPAGVSAGLTPGLLDAGLKVVDLSGDFRLKSGAVYKEWYKKEPADPAYVDQAVYGLSEVYGADLIGAALISNPGCYPTAALLGLIPALAAGWIDPRTIIIDGKSGASGAGRGLSLTQHFAEANENFFAYKVNQHQHTPEIEQVLGQVSGGAVTVTFTAHQAPMTRGILCTMYAALSQDHTEEEVRQLYRQYYEGRRFIRVREPGGWPRTKEVWGSNYCDIGLSLDPRTGRLTILSVIDNLVKGASGQAIQNVNLMMGWEETAGLEFAPAYP